jgi:hypothetical protein
MSLISLLVLILIVALILSLLGRPYYPEGVGYWPGGIVGTILVVVILLWLLGRV